MNTRKYQNITLTLPIKLLAKLDALAKAEFRSRSACVTRIVVAALAEAETRDRNTKDAE